MTATRRSFLKTVTTAAAAWPLRASGGMYLSLNSTLTGRMAWPDFARLAARVGYGGVDVNLSAAMRDGLEATRALFAEIKIKASNANLPMSLAGAEEAFQAELKKLDEAARFCDAIDCHAMVTWLPASSAMPKAEFRKMLKDRATACAEILRPSNVRLGLEFLGPMNLRTQQPYEAIWRMNEMVDVAKECGPNVGLLLDVWHWHHSGATRADIVAAGRSRIVHVHLSDAAKTPPEEVRDNHRLLAGEGVIDLTGFFDTLRQIGYDGGVSPEPIGRVPEGTASEEGARMGFETGRKYVY